MPFDFFKSSRIFLIVSLYSGSTIEKVRQAVRSHVQLVDGQQSEVGKLCQWHFPTTVVFKSTYAGSIKTSSWSFPSGYTNGIRSRTFFLFGRNLYWGRQAGRQFFVVELQIEAAVFGIVAQYNRLYFRDAINGFSMHVYILIIASESSWTVCCLLCRFMLWCVAFNAFNPTLSLKTRVFHMIFLFYRYRAGFVLIVTQHFPGFGWSDYFKVGILQSLCFRHHGPWQQ